MCTNAFNEEIIESACSHSEDQDICPAPITSPGFKLHQIVLFLSSVSGHVWFLLVFLFCWAFIAPGYVWFLFDFLWLTKFVLLWRLMFFTHCYDRFILPFFLFLPHAAVFPLCSPLCVTGTRRQSVTALLVLVSQTQKIPSKAETWQVFFTFHCSLIQHSWIQCIVL